GSYRPLQEFLATSDEKLPDGLIAAESVKRLRGFRKSGERFFLGVGFYKPHLPFVATREDWEAVAELEVPDAPHPGKIASSYWHKSGEFFQYTLPFARANPLPTEDRLTARRAYLAAVRYADRQIGKVLDALEETGLSRNTVVVVWSDHGWHLGEFSIWGKHTPFERALNSVLIVRAPGARAGIHSDALVETLDLYPTLIDLCQPTFRQTHHPLDGRSLVPLLTGERDSVREAAIGYWRKAISIRTPTHRLIASETEGKLTGVELYRMSAGPDVARNIAGENPELVERLWSFVPE
ncbi:MAG: sulfatase-like hydrolase/transferase, partial [bacterium]|nr:sulfatase-like hydrolase/transferase [bacterium]